MSNWQSFKKKHVLLMNAAFTVAIPAAVWLIMEPVSYTHLHALFVYIVPVLNFNTRINDGHKADALGFHLGGKI